MADENKPEEDQLTPEEETQAEMALSAALFDVENNSETFIGEGMTPEMLARFQEQIREIHAEEGSDEDLPPTIFEVIGKPELVSPEALTSKTEAERALEKILALLKRHKIDLDYDSVDELDLDSLDLDEDIDLVAFREQMGELSESEAADVYNAILTYVLPARLHPDDVEEGVELNLDQFFPDHRLEEIAESCSSFLLSLFNPDQDFREDLLSEEVKVNGELVAGEIAMLHLRNWQNQFTSIQPIGYQAGDITDLEEPDEDLVEFRFMVAYEVTLPDGAVDLYEGLGRAIMEEEIFGFEWMIKGLEFPGFGW